jgi:hypothetical protein
MIEVTGDLWEFSDDGEWVAVTTNGTINQKGECVMGRGTARDAKIRFKGIALSLGKLIAGYGNHVYLFPDFKLITFPVKRHWSEAADPKIITRSVGEIKWRVEAFNMIGSNQNQKIETVYMPRPGCANGGLVWENVRPLLIDLPDTYIVVEKKEEANGEE